MVTNQNATDASQADTTSSPPAQAATSTVQATESNPTLDDLQRQIAELRRENASHRKKNKEQEEAASQAEQARLAEQGEFKKLAEKHQARVYELEPVAQSYTKLAEQINAQIEAEIKDWPIEVKSLVPGVDVPAESRLEQLARLRPLLDKLQVQARGTLAGNRPNPPQAQPAATKAAQNDVNRRAFQTQRNYRI